MYFQGKAKRRQVERKNNWMESKLKMLDRFWKLKFRIRIKAETLAIIPTILIMKYSLFGVT